jgi:hypothetical protein
MLHLFVVVVAFVFFGALLAACSGSGRTGDFPFGGPSRSATVQDRRSASPERREGRSTPPERREGRSTSPERKAATKPDIQNSEE